MKSIQKEIDFAGEKLTLSTGKLAGQATGAVLASYGQTVVLATVVAAPFKEDWGYFPLQVEYQERLYAGGRIKGSRWVKREGKPSDDEILTARLIDRSIRPLFDQDYKKEIQVVLTVLSVDFENSPDVISAIAASAAIEASSISWNGPVSSVRVGLKSDGFVINPKVSEMENSQLDLIVSSVSDAVVMIESGASQVSEEKMLSAIEMAHKENQKLIKFISDFAKSTGIKKEIPEKEVISLSIQNRVKKIALPEIKKLISQMAQKEAGYSEYNEVKNAIIAEFEADEKSQAVKIFESLYKNNFREIILSGSRPDGRSHEQIRDLSAEVSVLPRTHGSALFSRGQTQALSITTLGAPSLEQLIESAEGEESKSYMHHYSMPPYSVGETGRMGSPNRREIGHGALAERAILPVLPVSKDFPYAIRVVTEILSSNGSTSMASVCGSTLSLMDAGVPILNPVAGIAMGLVVEDEKKFAILTDIVGIEDGNGDMDFKVAGTVNGITALQLDVKTTKLTLLMLEKALSQAKEARNKILEVMNKTISKPRAKVSEYAPKIKTITIPVDKIGELIGPGGKNIKGLIARTQAQIDVDDDGVVNISSNSEESVNDALAQIEAMIKEVEIGEIYEGEVKRLLNFGAFVEVLPGKEGLVHVSDMSVDFVDDPANVVKVGDRVKVRVKNIDDLGRINLSMLLDKSLEDKKNGRKKDFPRKDYQTKGRRDFDNRGRSNFSKGPHFPASRFFDDSSKNKHQRG